MATLPLPKPRFFREIAIAAPDSTAGAVLDRLTEPAEYNAFLVAFDAERWHAWARPIDHPLRKELRGLASTDEVGPILITDEWRVALAFGSEVPTESEGKYLLGERIEGLPHNAQRRHLLIVSDNDEPTCVFTLDVASADGPDDDQELVFHMALSDMAGNTPSSVAVDVPLLVSASLSLPGHEGFSNLDKATVKGLVGKDVRFIINGNNGLRFRSRAGMEPSVTTSWMEVEPDTPPWFETTLVPTQPGAAELRARLEVRSTMAGVDQVQIERVRFADRMSSDGDDFLMQVLNVAPADSVEGSRAEGTQPLAVESGALSIPPTPQLKVESVGNHLNLTLDGDTTQLALTNSELRADTWWPKYRQTLLDMVSKKYFSETDAPLELPVTAQQKLLAELATIGANIHAQLFKGSQAVAARLRAHPGGHLLIDDRGIRLPWELIYDGPETDSSDAQYIVEAKDVDVESFWGYRFRMTHVAANSLGPREQVSLRNRSKAWVHQGIATSQKASDGLTDAAVIVANKELCETHFGIEPDGSRAVQAIDDEDQLAAWFTAGLRADSDEQADFIYLLGHGSGTEYRTGLGTHSSKTKESWLELGSGQRIYLSILDKKLGHLPAWSDTSIVVVNACEALAPDPTLANGLVTTLCAEGRASTLVGPIAEVHPLFATAFIDRVLQDFTGPHGNQIGESLHNTIRGLLDEGNPYGLLYTLYGHSHITFERDT